jgi:voltage-gated potassium channel
MHPFRRLLPALVLLLIIGAVGISGYALIEGWNLLDSAYMVVITIFTIGFQEVNPLSPACKIFTMLIIVSGVGTAIYAAGRAVEIIVEGEMSGYQKRKRMDKKIREMKQHYIICGYGRVGHQVAQAFERSKVPYVVIDTKSETTAELEPRGIPHITGDATLDDILLEAGIKTAQGLVACSDSDVDNVYVTLSSRALNPNLRIVARAGIRDTEKKLIMAGADRVISPYFISGMRMAALATRPVTSDFLDLVTHGGQVEFSLHEMAVSERSPLLGKSLEEADIRGVSGAMVLAIRKADGSFDLQPKASSKIEQGSILVVLGTQEQIELLEKMARLPAAMS